MLWLWEGAEMVDIMVHVGLFGSGAVLISLVRELQEWLDDLTVDAQWLRAQAQGLRQHLEEGT